MEEAKVFGLTNNFNSSYPENLNFIKVISLLVDIDIDRRKEIFSWFTNKFVDWFMTLRIKKVNGNKGMSMTTTCVEWKSFDFIRRQKEGKF